jgi:hypothetical protein
LAIPITSDNSIPAILGDFIISMHLSCACTMRTPDVLSGDLLNVCLQAERPMYSPRINLSGVPSLLLPLIAATSAAIPSIK